MKRLIVCLLLVGVVGCGKNNDSAESPVKEMTIEVLAGTYERIDSDGMRFKLVIDESGTFKDSFELLGSFTEQASGKCKVVDKEVQLHYQTSDDLAEIVDIFRVQRDGSLTQIAGFADGERHDLSKEQQAETLDWMKKSESWWKGLLW